jgi:hypothetical protein
MLCDLVRVRERGPDNFALCREAYARIEHSSIHTFKRKEAMIIGGKRDGPEEVSF